MCNDIWAWIVIGIMLMVVYTYIASLISDWKKKKLREKRLPMIHEGLTTDTLYTVHLSNGHSFKKVRIVGSIEGEEAEILSFAGWAGVLVLLREDGKRIYLKKTAIRFVEEV